LGLIFISDKNIASSERKSDSTIAIVEFKEINFIYV
jgi:hypothetical protein